MTRDCRLILGTQNVKKGRELRQLLAPHQFDVRTLAEVEQPIDVEEDGATFAENAAKKAVLQAQHLHAWVLGEDSGLRVDALGGAPGIHSARYAGSHGNDQANNEKLLEKLADTPLAQRSAHYVCHVALADPEGEIRVSFERTCSGRILHQPRGSGGFGYDPLFEIVEYHQTFGELGETVKSVLSHRARAMRMLIPELLRLRNTGAWQAGAG